MPFLFTFIAVAVLAFCLLVIKRLMGQRKYPNSPKSLEAVPPSSGVRIEAKTGPRPLNHRPLNHRPLIVNPKSYGERLFDKKLQEAEERNRDFELKELFDKSYEEDE